MRLWWPRLAIIFLPLLFFLASLAVMSKRSIVEPIRNIFRKEVEDAQKIRRTVIDCFERASLPIVSDEEKKRIFHFAILGGGPTGVEFAASLHDFVNDDLGKLYPRVKDLVKITLRRAGDHILSMFNKRITAFAATDARKSMVYYLAAPIPWKSLV